MSPRYRLSITKAQRIVPEALFRVCGLDGMTLLRTYWYQDFIIQKEHSTGRQYWDPLERMLMAFQFCRRDVPYRNTKSTLTRQDGGTRMLWPWLITLTRRELAAAQRVLGVMWDPAKAQGLFAQTDAPSDLVAQTDRVAAALTAGAVNDGRDAQWRAGAACGAWLRANRGGLDEDWEGRLYEAHLMDTLDRVRRYSLPRLIYLGRQAS